MPCISGPSEAEAAAGQNHAARSRAQPCWHTTHVCSLLRLCCTWRSDLLVHSPCFCTGLLRLSTAGAACSALPAPPRASVQV